MCARGGAGAEQGAGRAVPCQPVAFGGAAGCEQGIRQAGAARLAVRGDVPARGAAAAAAAAGPVVSRLARPPHNLCVSSSILASPTGHLAACRAMPSKSATQAALVAALAVPIALLFLTGCARGRCTGQRGASAPGPSLMLHHRRPPLPPAATPARLHASLRIHAPPRRLPETWRAFSKYTNALLAFPDEHVLAVPTAVSAAVLAPRLAGPLTGASLAPISAPHRLAGPPPPAGVVPPRLCRP